MARSCTTCSTPWLQTIQFTGRIHSSLSWAMGLLPEERSNHFGVAKTYTPTGREKEHTASLKITDLSKPQKAVLPWHMARRSQVLGTLATAQNYFLKMADGSAPASSAVASLMPQRLRERSGRVQVQSAFSRLCLLGLVSLSLSPCLEGTPLLLIWMWLKSMYQHGTLVHGDKN